MPAGGAILMDKNRIIEYPYLMVEAYTLRNMIITIKFIGIDRI